jgi:diguanylate cyclase (GGDEF)-like protein
MPQLKAPVALVVDGVDGYQLDGVAGLRSVFDPLSVPLVIELLRLRGGAGVEPPSLARLVAPGRVSGVVIFPCSVPETLAQLTPLLAAAPELPRVYLGQLPPAGAGDVGGSVRGDNAMGMRLLVDHLVGECGVRRPLVVRGWPHHVDSVDREEALAVALAGRGLRLDPADVVTGCFNREASFRAVVEVLQRDPGYDAVICFNDRSAIGALDAARAVGRSVPEDIMVTGFDDDEFAALVRPGLTTVRQDIFAQGARSARLLLDLVGGAAPAALRHPVTLVRRGSTALAAPTPGGRDGAAEAGGRDWDFVWTRLTALDTAVEVSRSLLSCRTLGELLERLGEDLERLQVIRAFLVLRRDASDDASGDRSDGAPDDGAARGVVALAYVDGRLHDVSAETPFDLAEILPAHLAGHLDTGVLTLQPLAIGADELGYLLLDQPLKAAALVTDSLGMDLSRALDSIRTAERLAHHAEDLEQLVAERTRQLEAELRTRREAEDRLNSVNADLQVQIDNREAAEAELRRLNEELHALLSVDGLTGVANRLAFDEALARGLSNCSRSGAPLSIVMLDVDRFKAYNDEYGHLAGDEALRGVARCLLSATQRPSDLAARYGGEEFALVLPNTGTRGALAVAERVRAHLAYLAIPHVGAEGGQLTISMGIATVRPDAGTQPSDLVAVADRRLYAAKHAGRNRVVASDLVPAPGRSVSSP